MLIPLVARPRISPDQPLPAALGVRDPNDPQPVRGVDHRHLVARVEMVLAPELGRNRHLALAVDSHPSLLRSTPPTYYESIKGILTGVRAGSRYDRYGRGVKRVGVRCDVGPGQGIGHVMRCLALAEEVRRRDVELVFVCDAHTVPWAAAQIASRGFEVEREVSTPEEHLELFARLGLDAVVFDSYDLDASVYPAARATGVPTLAIVDGDFRGAEADLLVDQNLAAELDHPRCRATRSGWPACST